MARYAKAKTKRRGLGDNSISVEDTITSLDVVDISLKRKDCQAAYANILSAVEDYTEARSDASFKVPLKLGQRLRETRLAVGRKCVLKTNIKAKD